MGSGELGMKKPLAVGGRRGWGWVGDGSVHTFRGFLTAGGIDSSCVVLA